MAKIYTSMTVSLTKQTVIQKIEMPLGDTGRGLKVLVSDDLIARSTGSTGTTIEATLWGKKPSGKEVSIIANSIMEHEGANAYSILFDGSEQFANLIAEEGSVYCTITLSSEGKTVSTFNFVINVKDNVAVKSQVMSTQAFENVLQALDRLTEKEKHFEELEAKLDSQAKLTVNVRYGTGEPQKLGTDKQGDIYIRIK